MKDYCDNFAKTTDEVRESWKENGTLKTFRINRACKRYFPHCRGNGGCPYLKEVK